MSHFVGNFAMSLREVKSEKGKVRSLSPPPEWEGVVTKKAINRQYIVL